MCHATHCWTLEEDFRIYKNTNIFYHICHIIIPTACLRMLSGIKYEDENWNQKFLTFFHLKWLDRYRSENCSNDFKNIQFNTFRSSSSPARRAGTRPSPTWRRSPRRRRRSSRRPSHTTCPFIAIQFPIEALRYIMIVYIFVLIIYLLLLSCKVWICLPLHLTK